MIHMIHMRYQSVHPRRFQSYNPVFATAVARAADAVCLSRSPPFPLVDEGDQYFRDSIVQQHHHGAVRAPTLPVPTLRNAYAKKERESWIDKFLSESMKVKLNDKHGKESLKQCFKSEGVFRHCVLPMMRGGFLLMHDRFWTTIKVLINDFWNLDQMLQEYAMLTSDHSQVPPRTGPHKNT